MIGNLAFQMLRVGFTLGSILVSPVFLLLFLPIYLHRYLTAIFAKVFRPDLGKMLTTLSTNFSNDSLYTHSESFSLTIHVLKGHSPINNFQKSFITRVLESKFPDGTLRYPELTQYPYKWMGFYFWKPESDFNIQEHISQATPKMNQFLTREDRRRIIQKFHAKPFTKGKSPWEFQLAYSDHPVEGKQTILLVKIFHGMADGLSILKLLVEHLSQNDTSSNVKPKYHKRSFLENFVYWTTFPIRGTYEFSATALKVLLDKSPWYAPRKNRTYSVVGVSIPIDINRVKAVKNKFGVTITSVVHGLCSLSMRSYMTENKMPIPEKTVWILPFPMPGHPDKLRNFMQDKLTQVNSELHLQLDPEETLLKAVQIYDDIKKSAAPTYNFFVAKIMGGLYAVLCNALISPLIPSILLTNFPARFDKPVVFDGYECTETYVSCGLMNMLGLGFYTVTYVNALSIVVVADSSLMTESQAQHLADLVETELKKLEQLQPTAISQSKSKAQKKLLSLV